MCMSPPSTTMSGATSRRCPQTSASAGDNNESRYRRLSHGGGAAKFSGLWHSMLTAIVVLWVWCVGSTARTRVDAANTDIRLQEECIETDAENPLLLRQVCDIHWTPRYDPTDYVQLNASETFDGQNYTVDLTGVDGFKGLFTVSSHVQSFDKAPLMKNVHTINGTTAENGGFVVQESQRFFTVNHCSSTGKIQGKHSGGIVGRWSGRDSGTALVINSHSSGRIAAQGCGGVLGSHAGWTGGTVNVSRCYSRGDIRPDVGSSLSGGICGSGAGAAGQAYISQCYSTGTLYGPESGGIVGASSGSGGGFVRISQCFSSGDIIGFRAGGISGQWTDTVEILDSYTTGNIRPSSANTGGICGGGTATGGGHVLIKNVYMLSSTSRTFLIGGIRDNAGPVEVIRSVHNTSDDLTDRTSVADVNHDHGNFIVSGISGNLTDIRGRMYQTTDDDGNIHLWSSDIWVVRGPDKFPELRGVSLQPSCLEYDYEQKLYLQTCDIDWTNRGQGFEDGFIELDTGQVFDGQNYTIDLTGVEEFEGLFTVSESVQTFEEAPVIKDVHTINGSTAGGGGFIVRKEQRFVQVVHCSSSGEITGGTSGSGGIVGRLAGHTRGHMLVAYSYSSGRIVATKAGGIVGMHAAKSKGIMNITNCYSTGGIEKNAPFSGGICGQNPGRFNGRVYIQHCYSTGNIAASSSGGIVGSHSGDENGFVRISQCITSGTISGHAAGGVTGAWTGVDRATVKIYDSYTTGIIRQDSKNTGGICGGIGRNAYRVYVKNVFVLSKSRPFIFGEVETEQRVDAQVHVRHSVHSTLTGKTNATYLVDVDNANILEAQGNSGALDDIRGRLYETTDADGNIHRWPSDIWVVRGPDKFPELRGVSLQPSCLEYFYEQKLYLQTCDIDWTKRGQDFEDGFIELDAGHVFDGQNYTIDLTGVEEFEGLFTVSTNVNFFDEAPLIKNVHTLSGTTAKNGGFIVKGFQKFFKVYYSSNINGDIAGKGGGGIAGRFSGHDNGQILITHSHSTGRITGFSTGGIVASGAGTEGGTVNISNCYSTGDIVGRSAGGIAGGGAGWQRGEVYITQCYSIGEIGGKGSGGIAADNAADDHGFVHISECYTTGDIIADWAGGVSGDETAIRYGIVEIQDSYTTGQVKQDTRKSGCMCGSVSCQRGGSLYIGNTYMLSRSPGSRTFMIGEIAPSAKNVTVKYSVHDGVDTIVDQDDGNKLKEIGNSGDLNDIRGQLYHTIDRDGEPCQWSEDVWTVPNPHQFPQLRCCPAPLPTPLMTSTPTTSPTPSPSASDSPSETATPSASPSMTRYMKLSAQFPQKAVK